MLFNLLFLLLFHFFNVWLPYFSLEIKNNLTNSSPTLKNKTITIIIIATGVAIADTSDATVTLPLVTERNNKSNIFKIITLINP